MNNSPILRRLALKGIDLGRKTEIAKYLPMLEQSQWLHTKSLAQMQIVRLQQILAFASQYVPFYIRHCEQNKWHPKDFGSLSDLGRLPVISKEILRTAPDEFRPMRSHVQPAYKSRQTGGSTGEPLSYRISNDAFGMLRAAGLRVKQSSGYKFGDGMLTLGGASLNNPQSNAIAQGIYNLLGNNHSISVGQLDEAHLNKIVTRINAICPSLIYGYPSILYLVARQVVKHKIVLKSIERIITTSEMLFPRQRKYIEQAFNAPIYDEYGCAEAGLIAGECDYHQGLHYAMELCLVEVLDDANRRVEAGHIGHLVATNLLNRSMCFIRYDTGDVGALCDERCDCGRGLLQITNLEGRTRDLIYTPGKRIIHGVEINHLVYDHPWVDRYQIIQETSHQLTLMLGISKEIDGAKIEKLRSQIADHSGMVVTVKVNVPFIETNGKKNRLIISKILMPDQGE